MANPEPIQARTPTLSELEDLFRPIAPDERIDGGPVRTAHMNAHATPSRSVVAEPPCG